MLRFIVALCFVLPFVCCQSVEPIGCGPVCEIYCPNGNVLDARGCPTCRCKPGLPTFEQPSSVSSVCGRGQTALEGYSCGRTANRKDCPSTHYCKISPTDAYAVCCPRNTNIESKANVAPTVKAGSCPTRDSGLVGICVAFCSTDGDCEGNKKCCGGCPRACVSPSL